MPRIPPTGSTSRLVLELSVAGFGRLLLNTARRFPYPFAPALGRGLGVPLPAVTSAIALSQATGLLSPLFGPLGDRWGYRAILLGGLWVLAAGMGGAWALPAYGVVAAGMVLAGLGKSVFDPAVQAYVGQRVPIERRGLAIGMGELAWSLSSLVGIPVAGLLIATHGWRSPFLVLGVLGVAAALALAAVLPRGASAPAQPRSRGLRAAWGEVLGHRPALGGLAFGFFVSMANDNLFVVYGAWLESSFSLGVAALGVATTAIGVAELVGEAGTALLADRLGLARGTLLGTALSGLAYALLPLTSSSLAAALAGLFVLFVTYEFGIVTSFSLLTEALPGARGTMMSSYVAALGLGRVAGALLGGPLWLWGGLPAVGLTSAGLVGAAVAALRWGSATRPARGIRPR